MPNFLSSNRFRNIFDTGGGNIPSTSPYGKINFGPTGLYEPGQVSPNIEDVGVDNYDITNRMKELYQPTNDATQNFEGMINQYPQRENPSLLRRIGAMLVDYTKGPEAGRAMMDQPFNEKLMDWKNKIGPSQQAANLERYENSNDRTMAYQTISAELRDRAQAAKERNDEAKMKVSQHRADIYDFKARNPQMKIILPQGGNVTAINPQNGQTTDLGIPTGSLTETDKINLQQENAMARIGATGEQARQTEGMRQTGRENIAETRGWSIFNIPDPTKPGQTKAIKINAITGEVQDVTQDSKSISEVTKPSSGGGKPETAANKLTRQYLLASELKNTRPDLAPFIELDKRGTKSIDITPHVEGGKDTFWGKSNSSGPTVQQAKEINDAIYGSGLTMGPSSTDKTMTKTQTNTKTGEKRTLVSNDGGKTWKVQ